MAWLERSPSGYYQIAFRFGDERIKKSLKTKDYRKATARVIRVDENIQLLEAGRLAVPEDADLREFLLSDGRLNDRRIRRPKRNLRTLQQFSAACLDSIPDGALEASTISSQPAQC